MRNKTRVRLTILTAAFLLFFGLFLLKDPLARVLQPKSTQPLASIKPDTITALTIQTENTTNNLQKKNNQWILAKDKSEYKADSTRIQQVIDTLLSMEKGEVVSTNKNKHKDLGINKKKIVLKAGDITQTIYVGNSTSSQSLVRLNNDDEVFTTTNLDSAFMPEDYRNLNLGLVNDESKVTTVKVIHEGGEFNLVNNKNTWTINGAEAKKEQVDYFLTDLKSLHGNDATVDSKVRNALASPTVTLTVKEGTTERKATFYYKDETAMYATTSISSLVYTVPTSTVDSIKVDQNYFAPQTEAPTQ